MSPKNSTPKSRFVLGRIVGHFDRDWLTGFKKYKPMAVVYCYETGEDTGKDHMHHLFIFDQPVSRQPVVDMYKREFDVRGNEDFSVKVILNMNDLVYGYVCKGDRAYADGVLGMLWKGVDYYRTLYRANDEIRHDAAKAKRKRQASMREWVIQRYEELKEKDVEYSLRHQEDYHIGHMIAAILAYYEEGEYIKMPNPYTLAQIARRFLMYNNSSDYRAVLMAQVKNIFFSTI